MTTSETSRWRRTSNAFASLLKGASRPILARVQWLALGLLLAVGLFTFWNTARVIESTNTRKQLHTLLNELQGILTLVDDAETGQRGYLLVGDESYLDHYKVAVKAIDGQIDKLEKLISVVPRQRSNFNALRRLVTAKFVELKRTVQLAKAGSLETALQIVRTGQGRQRMDDIRMLAAQINVETHALADRQDARAATLSLRAIICSVFGNALAAILFIAVLRRTMRDRKREEARARELARIVEAARLETDEESDKEIEALEQQARELAVMVETSRVQTLMQSEGKIEALGNQAGELARSVESLRIQALTQLEEDPEAYDRPSRDLADEIEALGLQARELARTVETSRIQTLHQSDEKIEALGLQAQELARSVESSRLRTLKQSDNEIEALGQQARDLATFVESSRVQTLAQSDDKIEAMGQRARDLATSVETSRLQTLKKSDKEIEALGERARELATSVESSRLRTLKQSDQEIAALGQQARELATSVETSRLQTLKQSDKEIEALAQQARDLAAFVESARMQTLMQSDGKIEALGQQARELARCVETLRLQTLKQSDGKIEALGQQARELATFVESARIETLNQSNLEIRKLNEGLELRVVERTAQLQAANKELDAFSYSVSHDLRAPLRAIDGFSRILIEDHAESMPDEAKTYLQLVRDNTRQMGQLVDDLLAFARFGRQPLNKHGADPEAIVQRCLQELTKEQEGRQVEIVIGDLPACDADPALLKQVWTNLLSNALKYTRKKEIARIEIGSRQELRPATEGQPASPDAAPETVYYVKDNGAGFDMKYVKKLFGVFQRLHRATDYEGTGVGLAIVQRIVQRHGGRIWADAKLNEGATFFFTLV